MTRAALLLLALTACTSTNTVYVFADGGAEPDAPEQADALTPPDAPALELRDASSDSASPADAQPVPDAAIDSGASVELPRDAGPDGFRRYDAAPDMPPSCAADGYEPNDTREGAPIVGSVDTETFSTEFAQTFSAGDTVDWLAFEAERDSARALRLSAWDSDTRADVTVRVRCLTGLTRCASIGEEHAADWCQMTRREIAYVDVICANTRGAVQAWVGVAQGTAGECLHTTTVQFEPVP